MATHPPRYLPDLPLPPYAYLPGRFPHPTRDPGGHLQATTPSDGTYHGLARWREWTPYLRGVDLFNHGYYWEAHEAWEQAWHACGRQGATGDLLRGLIHLAGAGFALRRGKSSAGKRHARLAARVFGDLRGSIPGGAARLLGLRIDALSSVAERIASGGGVIQVAEGVQVEVVFDWHLCPA